MRALAAILASAAALAPAAALAACGGSAASTQAAASRHANPPQPSTPPAPQSRLPTGTAALATALASDTRELDGGIQAWLKTDPPRTARPPETVTLWALHQQRIYRYLRLRPALAAAVIARLPGALRSQARDNYRAGRSLYELMPKKTPKTQPPIRPGTAAAPQQLLAWYRTAQSRFGVRWQLLAAVNLVESGFNRLRNNSYAGAQGPMQFEPATWRAYGLGGDVHDPHDAIMGAANYLRASGAPRDDRLALYHYNPSRLYVDAVIRYAHQMQLHPDRYYAYWSWQVFVRDRQLTGPGASSASGSR